MTKDQITARYTAGARALLVMAAGRVERLQELNASRRALATASRDLRWAEAAAQEWGIDVAAELAAALAAATETPR